MVQSNEVEYDVRIVAFLDILGFKHLVFRSKDEAIATIRNIDTALNHVLNCLTMEGGPDWFSVKLFSDCFCLTCEDIHSNLYYMLNEVSFLQWYLSTSGIFVSGGLASGPHFENERIIFSEGLINAYELQKKDPYPRVLIAESIVQRIINEPMSHYKESLINHLIIGPDGLYFLDYLQGINEMFSYGGDIDLHFEAHKDAIVKEVRDNLGNHAITEKYRWLSEYHNFKFKNLYNPDDWEDDYFSELEEKILVPMTEFPSFEKDEPSFFKSKKSE